MWWLTNLHYYISSWISQSNNIKILVKVLWYILFNIFLFSLFRFVSTALTIIINICPTFFDFHVGRIHQGTYGAALTSRGAELSGCCMPLSSSMLYSLYASLSSSQSYRFMEVTIPVEPLFGVRNTFRCAPLITGRWMEVNAGDLADI